MFPAAGTKEIDAAGLDRRPWGLSMSHTHAEDVDSQPKTENFLRMGVTTLVLGQLRDFGDQRQQFFSANWRRKNSPPNVANLDRPRFRAPPRDGRFV